MTFVNVRQQRRELAQLWAELRKTLKHAHKAGQYCVAATLRQSLNRTAESWSRLRAYSRTIQPHH